MYSRKAIVNMLKSEVEDYTQYIEQDEKRNNTLSSEYWKGRREATRFAIQLIEQNYAKEVEND